jgi:hypothetical protein
MRARIHQGDGNRLEEVADALMDVNWDLRNCRWTRLFVAAWLED